MCEQVRGRVNECRSAHETIWHVSRGRRAGRRDRESRSEALEGTASSPGVVKERYWHKEGQQGRTEGSTHRVNIIRERGGAAWIIWIPHDSESHYSSSRLSPVLTPSPSVRSPIVFHRIPATLHHQPSHINHSELEIYRLAASNHVQLLLLSQTIIVDTAHRRTTLRAANDDLSRRYMD